MKNTSKPFRAILTTLFLGILGMAHSQNLPMEKAKADLLFLRENIQTYNPALHEYNPDFDNSSLQVIDELNGNSISLLKYFSALSRICALSNEGHFGIGDWSDTVHQGISKSIYKYLPVKVKVLNDQLYVWQDYSNEQQLKKGQEIITINDLPAASIIQDLRKFIPCDGMIRTYANKQIELGFGWMHYLYIAQPDNFRISIKTQSGQVLESDIAALTLEEQRNNARKLQAQAGGKGDQGGRMFSELKHEENYSILKLPSFDRAFVREQKIKPGKFYKDLFEELSDLQCKNLIIDLRYNTGGLNEFADDIVPHILKNPSSDPFLKKTISWEGKERTYKLPKASKYVFQGNIYVLVNGKTYSAANTLARYLKEYGNAIMIGEETGTRYEGFAAGSKQYITLPLTDITIKIPRYHILFPKSRKQTTSNRGLIPDHNIEYTIDDIVNEKDLHLEKALLLIEENEKQ